ncbi:hypothetical protein ACIG87_17325 [Micromonospora sp. NPDC051925]|uniref:ABC transporter permease subunit n=1 Tax=Micromonospora sp. NPDC051925 TaxID=3364288 RepID=UPI0037CA17E2
MSRCDRVGGSPTGRVLAGLRDDERRIGVLGLDPYRFKLVAFTLAGGLASAGGVVYSLIAGGGEPARHHLRPDPVTAGHGGARWPGYPQGPLFGGILYALLDHRLTHPHHSTH